MMKAVIVVIDDLMQNRRIFYEKFDKEPEEVF